MVDILWIDTETTGLDSIKHGLTQLSCLVDREGEIVNEFDILIKPFKGCKVSKSSLDKQNITIDDLKNNPDRKSYSEAFDLFIDFLSKYVNRYDKNEKFVLAGKNVKFDIQFLREFFLKNGDSYFGSWFFYPSIDLDTLIAESVAFDGLRLFNYQLETICEAFDVKIRKAHNSLYDIRATREVYWKIKELNDTNDDYVDDTIPF